ncbi:MAG: hypothetical protein K2G88_01360, partial [Oscillospiraceae bacterium]|nr:hypothetical protein [Oscillospiraceae bacterium]
CCKEPQERHRLKITLDCTEKEVSILIGMKSMKEIRKDWSIQGSTQHYSNSFGEELILDIFCNRHNGSWNLIEKKQEEQVTRYCKIIFKPDTKQKLIFNSPKFIIPEEEFFNIYHVMLAKICVGHD